MLPLEGSNNYPAPHIQPPNRVASPCRLGWSTSLGTHFWLGCPYFPPSPSSGPCATFFIRSLLNSNIHRRNCRYKVCITQERCPPNGFASSRRGHLGVIMHERPRDPPLVATSSLACPIFAATYIRKKELLHHMRTSADEPHKSFRYDACALVNAPRLLALGILPCLLACGALFDWGKIRTSKPSGCPHSRKTRRARRPGASPPRRELDGPYM